jgi:hypothetical protein
VLPCLFNRKHHIANIDKARCAVWNKGNNPAK